MSVIFIVLPLAILFAGVGVLAFIWSVRDGQMDDLDSPAVRVLFPDDGEGAANREPRAARRG